MVPQTAGMQPHISIVTTQLLTIFSGCEQNMFFSGSDQAEWDEIREITKLFSQSQSPYLTRELGSKCILSNWTISTALPLWPKVTRFNFCKAYIYNSYFVDRRSDDLQPVFHDLYNYMVCVPENPNFIITLSNTASSTHADSFKYGFPGLHKIARLPVSAVFLFVFGGELVRMLCLPCLQPLRSTGKKIYLHPVVQLEKKAIVNQYELLHADVGGTTVHYKGATNVAGDCSPKYWPRGHLAGACTVHVLARQLNISLKYESQRTLPLFFPEDVISSLYADFFFDSFKHLVGSEAFPARYDWLRSGQKVYKYSFIQVLPLDSLSVGTILNAVELPLWLLFGFTVVALLAVLRALTTSIILGGFEMAISAVMLIVSFTLEKCEIAPKLRAALTFRATCLLTLWALSSMVTTGMYKGALYSTLSSPILPQPPSNVKNIMESKNFFFSTATVYVEPHMSSLFHYSISGLLAASPNSSWTDLLDNFCRQLVYIRTDPINIVNPNHGEHKPLEGTINDEPVNVTLPGEYIFMEENFRLNVFRFMSKLTGALKSKVILRGTDISFLTQRLPVVVFGNFFSSIFSKLLDHYTESGTWDLWERWSDIWRVLTAINSTQNASFIKKTNALALLFENFHSIAFDKAEELSPKSLNLVNRMVAVYFMGVLASCLCLVLEKLRNRLFLLHESSSRATKVLE